MRRRARGEFRARIRKPGPRGGGRRAGDWADSLGSLTDAAHKGRIGMSRPSLGTVGGHVAALYVLWGGDAAGALFGGVGANDVRLVGGNSVGADMVGRGQLDAGLTDNDDVENARAEGG